MTGVVVEGGCLVLDRFVLLSAAVVCIFYVTSKYRSC